MYLNRISTYTSLIIENNFIQQKNLKAMYMNKCYQGNKKGKKRKASNKI